MRLLGSGRGRGAGRPDPQGQAGYGPATRRHGSTSGACRGLAGRAGTVWPGCGRTVWRLGLNAFRTDATAATECAAAQRKDPPERTPSYPRCCASGRARAAGSPQHGDAAGLGPRSREIPGANGTETRLDPVASLLALVEARVVLPAPSHPTGLHGNWMPADRRKRRKADDESPRHGVSHEPAPCRPIDAAGRALAATGRPARPEA